MPDDIPFVRDTRTGKEKWEYLNQKSLQRQAEARNNRRSANTGMRPIEDNGMDEVPRRDPLRVYQGGGGGAGGGGPSGILLVSKDGTETFISSDTILSSYGSSSDWSVELTISSLSWTGAVTYSTATGFYDNTGSSQSKSYIPIYRNGNLVATYGVYKEGLAVEDGELYVEFYSK